MGNVHPSAFNQGWVYYDDIPHHQPPTIVLDYYTQRYRHSDRATWRTRIESGQVRLNDRPTTPDTLLEPGQRLSYHRSPWQEPAVPLDIDTLYEDDILLVDNL